MEEDLDLELEEIVPDDIPSFRHFHRTDLDEALDGGSVAAPQSAGLLATPTMAPLAADLRVVTAGRAAPTPHAVGTPQFALHEIVRSFLLYFRKQIKERNVHDIHSVYENSFNKLSEKYFKNSPWPSVDVVAPLVDNDATFLLLYNELYFRHIYSKLTPTLQQRLDSWQNYCDLFAFLLAADNSLELDLPSQWLWDIIDEYIYQFQTFHVFRAKAPTGSDLDKTLRQHDGVWNVLTVLDTLQRVVDKSKILTVAADGRHVLAYTGPAAAAADADAGATPTHPVFRMLGFFAIIGQCRLHSLLGDYYLALKTLEPIEIGRKGLYGRVAACQLTLYYYLGFAYLMMRRPLDAIKSFTHILLYVSRTKQYHTRSYQYDQILKKSEQMYALLAIVLSLCPQRIDENIHAVLKERYGTKMYDMQQGNIDAFSELFLHACPKFVPLAPSKPLADGAHYAQEATQLQLSLFLQEVRQQHVDSHIAVVRSYLKLYSSIPISKLGKYLDADEANVRTFLMCYKHKTNTVVWRDGSVADGRRLFTSDVNFHLEQDMVHIVDNKIHRRYGEFFMRHISKFEELQKSLAALPAAPVAAK